MSSSMFKNVANYLFTNLIYIKQDSVLNNLQGLMCYKRHPTNQPTVNTVSTKMQPRFIDLFNQDNNVKN